MAFHFYHFRLDAFHFCGCFRGYFSATDGCAKPARRAKVEGPFRDSVLLEGARAAESHGILAKMKFPIANFKMSFQNDLMIERRPANRHCFSSARVANAIAGRGI
jgi:hypothetical protein